jgi:sulfonate transport system permease protein
VTAPLRLLGSIVVAAALIAIWQFIADADLIPAVFLPGPAAAFEALAAEAETGELWRAIAGTMWRMAEGFIAATVIGISAGVMIGLSPRARTYLDPTLEVLRPLPATAVIPVAILLLGLTQTMIVAVIAFGAVWPVLLGTIQGLKTIEPRLVQLSHVLEMSRLDFVRKIALPNAVPDIFAGLRLALTISLILAVVTEMLSAQVGLGSIILLAARSFRSADLYGGVAVLGILGFATNALLERTERWVLRWRD